MDKKQIIGAIKQLKEESKKRNFSQTFDLIINLRHLDLKKPENQVDFYLTLQHGKGKANKVCAFVGPESKDDAKGVCDFIGIEDFDSYKKDAKKVKQLADKYDVFIAQANIMPQVAATFGRVLGTRQKMPNPKAGAVFPPKANIEAIVQKFTTTIRISAKKAPTIMVPIGGEKDSEEDIAENVMNTYNQIIHHLPNELNNVRNVLLKLTMGKPVHMEK
ncbi:50S ribosomal protein L1 [Candidatus Woesearchaeota archaeon]|nr:50S ribosomal protein L1 [Candidatus Woesearchaeota archaeon]